MIQGMSSNPKLNQKIDQNEDLKFETWKKTIIPKSFGQKKYFEKMLKMTVFDCVVTRRKLAIGNCLRKYFENI